MIRSCTLILLFYLVGCMAPEPSRAPRPKPLIKTAYEISSPNINLKSKPVLPPYPADAKAAHIQGDVVVAVTIDKEGRPLSAKAIQGPRELIPYAETVIMQMTFNSVAVNGNPPETTFQFTMPFRLR